MSDKEFNEEQEQEMFDREDEQYLDPEELEKDEDLPDPNFNSQEYDDDDDDYEVSQPRKKTNPLVLGVGVFLLFAFGAIGFYLISQPSQPDPSVFAGAEGFKREPVLNQPAQSTPSPQPTQQPNVIVEQPVGNVQPLILPKDSIGNNQNQSNFIDIDQLTKSQEEQDILFNTKLDALRSDFTLELNSGIQKAIHSNSTNDNSELVGNINKNISTLSVNVEENDSEIKKLKSLITELSQKVESQEKQLLAKVEEVKVEQEVKEEEAKVKSLTDGRERLDGFKVMMPSEDKAMSIVKTPSGNVNVYFKGETFRYAGKTHKVSSIEKDGLLVLVGTKYYIDETYVKPKQVARTTSTSTAKKPTLSKEKEVTEEKPKEESVEKINGRVVLQGWGKSGEYAKGYFVSDPNGNWYTVRIGEYIDGFGRIVGEDLDGNLIVGDKVIKKAVYP